MTHKVSYLSFVPLSPCVWVCVSAGVCGCCCLFLSYRGLLVRVTRKMQSSIQRRSPTLKQTHCTSIPKAASERNLTPNLQKKSTFWASKHAQVSVRFDTSRSLQPSSIQFGDTCTRNAVGHFDQIAAEYDCLRGSPCTFRGPAVWFWSLGLIGNQKIWFQPCLNYELLQD